MPESILIIPPEYIKRSMGKVPPAFAEPRAISSIE